MPDVVYQGFPDDSNGKKLSVGNVVLPEAWKRYPQGSPSWGVVTAVDVEKKRVFVVGRDHYGHNVRRWFKANKVSQI